MKAGMSAAVLAALVVISASASATYKCETATGISYSDLPCEGGKRLELNTAPVDGSGAHARGAAKEKSKLAQLERERHRKETAEVREHRAAMRSSAAKQKKCNGIARRQKWANEEVSASAGKANERARQKARRIGEVYEAECGRWYEREMSVAR